MPDTVAHHADMDTPAPRTGRAWLRDAAGVIAAIGAAAGVAWLASDVAVWALLDEGRLLAMGIGP